MPACWRIWAFVKLTISLATSRSRMRDSDAARFSAATARLLTVCSRRFCAAPKVPRRVLISAMAVSTDAMSETSAAEVSTSPKVTVRVWPWSAPTWKSVDAPPVRRETPLNLVFAAMSPMAAWSSVTSASMLAWESASLVPFAYWTASSRIRWSMLWTSVSAPSAVWTIEMPSWAFRPAWLRPRTWARSFSLMARPAASSAARLMRRPEESFSTDLPKFTAVALRLRCALRASTLVLMRIPI